MATNFKTIRASIKAVIDAAIAGSSTIQECWNYERSTFAGFPAVIIVPTDNEADYGSTDNDKMVFAFKIRAYYPIPKEGEHADAEVALEAVVDELLTLFKARGALGVACDWVAPAPSVWEYEERGEGVYRVAQINLKCIKYVGNL